MCYTIASVKLGMWRLAVLDITPADTAESVMQFDVSGNDFDFNVHLPSTDSLALIADAIESSENVDVTAEERCFLRWGVAEFYIFAGKGRLTFLLLDRIVSKRFRISVPIAHKDDFVTALRQLKVEADAEL